MSNERKYAPKYEDKWLPSKNLQYPDGFKVHYYPFTYGDTLKINSSNMSDSELYRFILDGVETLGIDKYDLTFYDVLYLGWRRKTSSLAGSVLDTHTYCPNCDTKNIKLLSLSDDVNYVDTGIKALPIKTKICKEELHFNFITVRSFMELLDRDLNHDVIAIYAKSVSNRSYDEAYEILYNATGKDLDKIDRIDSLLYHGIEKMKVNCRECKKEYFVSLSDSSEVEILKPFRREDDPMEDEISFG
jgi:hypothetical protein